MKTLITGASRGIGYAICQELARQGHELLMVAKNPEKLNESADAISKEFKAKTYTFAQDLTAKNAIKNVTSFVKKSVAGLQNLVLSAGIFLEGDLRGGTREALEKQMEINFYSIFHLIQALLPCLDRAKSCRIVIIGSTAGFECSSSSPLYSITKWAVRGYAANLRRELRDEKIAVTHVAPGGVYTDMWEGAGVPPERLMKPTDIGKMVAAVLSLSGQADVEEIVVRPILGDLHN